jgi:hypothetical protein
MMMTHRSVPLKRKRNLSHIGENISVTFDMIPTHIMQKQLSEKSRSSNSDQELFFNPILKIQASGTPNSDLKMAVTL